MEVVSHVASEDISSTTSTSWQDALSVTVPADGDYLVFFGAGIKRTNGNGNGTEYQLLHNSTVLTFTDSDVRHNNPMALITKISASANDTVKLQFRPNAAWGDFATVAAGSALAIMPAPDGVQLASSNTETAYNTDTDFQNYVTLTFNPTAQDYLICGSISIKAGNHTDQVSARIYNETDTDEVKIYQCKDNPSGLSTKYKSMTILKKVTLTALQRTIRLQYKTHNTGTTVTVKYGYLVAIPLGNAQNINHVYDASEEGGTNNNWNTAVTTTWTPVASLEYLQLYCFVHGLTNNGSYGWENAQGRVRASGTAIVTEGEWYTGQLQNHHRAMLFLKIGVLGATERTDDCRMRRGDGAGFATAFDSTIFSFTGFGEPPIIHTRFSTRYGDRFSRRLR